MKKLLFVAVIGASLSMVACGESTTTEAKKDSVTAVTDSVKTAIDSSASAKKDSVTAVADTAKKAIDSAKVK